MLLQREAEQMAAGANHAVLKLIVSRGQGGRGYRQPDDIHPTRLFSLHPYPSYPDSYRSEGITARICRHRLGLNPALAGIKHLNRLEQIMARAEWRTEDIQEGLMLDQKGFVIEGTMSNVFCIKEQRLFTAPIERCGVAGIVRGIVLSLAGALNINVKEAYFTADQLRQADEIFVTNSVIGIWPIRELEGQVIAAGPLTSVLQQAYRQLRLLEMGHD